MSVAAANILSHLQIVDRERQIRSAQPHLQSRVTGIKSFQHRRFSKTYADLLASTRYGPAARFFLNELYGPKDFEQRDAQFARVVPALVRLFPQQIVETVSILGELHALSETLDSAMGDAAPETGVSADEYLLAWQQVGRQQDRATQVQLMVEVAARLDRITRNPLLRSGLRLMRAPAEAAGLGDLQRFLETGFDTFGAMKGSGDFVAIIQTRETELATALFSATREPDGASSASMRRAIALLPEARVL